MPTTTLRVAYRPVRVGFLVRADSLDDLRRAATLATWVWGGIRDPIIPVSDDDDETDRLIAIWQVDVLFAVDAEDDLSRRAIARHGHLRLPGGLGHRGLFEPVGDDELGAVELGAVDVRMQISHYWEDTYRHGQNSAGALPVWSTDDHFAPLWAVLFGVYGDEQPGPRFRKAFVEGLRASRVEISGDVSPQLAVLGNPLSLTGDGLIPCNWPSRGHGLVLGDPTNPEHLRHFWNLRSLGMSVAFWPLEDGLRCVQFCQAHVRQIPTSQDDLGLCLWKCGGWAQGESLSPALRDALPAGIKPVRAGVGDWTWSQPSYRPVVWAARSESVLASVEETRWGTRRMVFPLQAGGPYPHSRVDFHHAYWIVQVSPLTEFSYEPGTIRLPALPDLNEWASRKLTAHARAVRLTGRSVDFFAHHRDSSLDLSLLTQKDIVRKIFDRAGISVSLSSAGEVTGRIIEQMGGLPGCRIFRIPGVRKLLAASRPQRENDALRTLEDRGTLNRDYRRAGAAREILDELLRLQALQSRLELQCPECRIRQLYLPEALATEIKCPSCQSVFLLAPLLRGCEAPWKFAPSGLFAEDGHRGSIAVILAMLRLENTFPLNQGLFLLPSHNLGANGIECESDLLVLELGNDGIPAVAVGEVKGEGEIEPDDIRNLDSVADEVRSSGVECYLIFATTRESFTESEKKLFRDYRERISGQPALGADQLEGYSRPAPILFTLRELRFYETYDEEARAEVPWPHPLGLRELAENSAKLYLDG
ncbi:MAG: hypothetical protein OXG37_00605 [Actinomycetia bacterium]|nr:hypothetical protein [Actinomycetes bacterium]